ncbi:MAG: phage integrase SAM-like domain-containing protein [Planctomycetaceae bacterium]
MASISHDRKSGRRTIQFKDNDGSRKSIRLGKCDQKTAQAIRTQIEHLAAAKRNGTAMPPQTSEWLRTIDETLRGRIASTGLIDARKSGKLQEFIEGYIQSRVDAKPRTIKKWNTTARMLREFLGEGRDIRTVLAGDADGFKLHLMGLQKADGSKKYSPSTLAKHIEGAKLFFKAAVRNGVASANPFQDVTASKRTNPDREYFVSMEEIQKCIDATADQQWQLIIALSRFGGLRTPSEHVRLRWEDILWDQDKMRVQSPKTEHHEGMESRLVPIYPELRPYLDKAWELAEDKAEFVVTKIRDGESNLRTTFQKIIKRAGLTPWPKLFQNLRASRQTELQEIFPTHVVCKWMGNSPKVAQKHYLQTTEEHFAKAVHNPVQQSSAGGGNAPSGGPAGDEKTPENTES